MPPPPNPLPADGAAAAASLPRHSPPRAGGLFISLLGAAQVCSWGSLYYAFPLIAQAMSEDLGWSKTQLYGAATLGLALAGLAAYPIGAAIDAGRGRLVIWLALPHAPVRVVGSVIVAVFPVAFLALEFMPPSFYGVAAFAVGFGAVNGIMTIVRGLVVPEMLTRRAYGAVNGALAIPATAARAVAPAGLALLWSAAGSYDAVLAAVIIGSLVLAAGFWSAAFLSRRPAAVC